MSGTWPPPIELGQTWWLGKWQTEYRLVRYENGEIYGESVAHPNAPSWEVSATPAEWVDAARNDRAGPI